MPTARSGDVDIHLRSPRPLPRHEREICYQQVIFEIFHREPVPQSQMSTYIDPVRVTWYTMLATSCVKIST